MHETQTDAVPESLVYGRPLFYPSMYSLHCHTTLAMISRAQKPLTSQIQLPLPEPILREHPVC